MNCQNQNSQKTKGSKPIRKIFTVEQNISDNEKNIDFSKKSQIKHKMIFP